MLIFIRTFASSTNNYEIHEEFIQKGSDSSSAANELHGSSDCISYSKETTAQYRVDVCGKRPVTPMPDAAQLSQIAVCTALEILKGLQCLVL